jgi:O-antigen biosynthesis protein
MTLDSHHLAQVLCRPATRVLDVGCGPGTVAQRLVALGCEVVGLDIDPSAVDAMGELTLDAHVVDLDRDDVNDILGDDHFDVIVCLDVLEHTKDPSRVLGCLLEQLRPDGDVVVSLPNITHGDVRLSLLGGKFEYTQEGLLDATHLHFFDGDAVRQLLADNGLIVREMLPVRYPLGSTELAVDLDSVDPSVLAELEADPDSTVYQWVFRCQRKSAQDVVPPMAPIAEELHERIEAQNSAERHQTHLLTQLAALEAEIQARDEYVAELSNRINGLEAEQVTAGEAAEEELDFLRRELSTNGDVIDIISNENAALHERVAEHAAATQAARGELVEIQGRRVYRLADSLTRLMLTMPFLGRVLRGRTRSVVR